jgi:hypothetical protein
MSRFICHVQYERGVDTLAASLVKAQEIFCMTEDTNASLTEKPAENAAVVGSPALPQDELNKLTDDIVAALKTVYDPEIPSRYLRTRALFYKIDYRRRPGGQDRYVADIAELPCCAGVADHGRECGV